MKREFRRSLAESSHGLKNLVEAVESLRAAHGALTETSIPGALIAVRHTAQAIKRALETLRALYAAVQVAHPTLGQDWRERVTNALENR